MTMNDRSVFHLISDLTDKKGVNCILIGGFAVNHYKVSRQTADVDFLMTKEDFDKIAGSLESAGYKQTFGQDNFAQFKSGRLSLMNIDFMFVDQDTLIQIKNEGKEIKIAGQKLIVPSLNHLIALKLHSIKNNPKIRLTRDLPDIVGLIRINDVNFTDKKFKELCYKYGNEEIFNKLMEILK